MVPKNTDFSHRLVELLEDSLNSMRQEITPIRNDLLIYNERLKAIEKLLEEQKDLEKEKRGERNRVLLAIYSSLVSVGLAIFNLWRNTK